MRAFFLHLTSLALLACVAAPGGATAQGDGDTQRLIERVETGLPSIEKDGRTASFALQEWLKVLGVPAVSVAVIDDYKIAWAKGYGVIEAGTNAPVTEKTLFQAASISKPVTALAVLRQVEQGTFDLDTDINEYLQSWKLPASELPGAGKVTLRDLLAHSAGITPGGFAGYTRDAALPTIPRILEGDTPGSNQAARVVAVPGEAVSYSGLGYLMLELALTDRLGKTFGQIIDESVFDPVGMHESTFEQVVPDSLESRVARGHRVTGAVIEDGWYAFPELAAAGMWTTPSDLALMVIEVARSKAGESNRILSADMTRRMLTQHREHMGLGFVIRPGDEHGYFSHSGGNQGYRCHFAMLADTGQGVVVMTNSDAGRLILPMVVWSVARAYDWPSDELRPVSDRVTDDIFDQLDRAPTARTRVDIDEDILAGYVGRYELTPEMVFEVTLARGHLEVSLGNQPRFPVYPESETTFFYEVVDAQLTFVRSAAGETVSLILHQGGRDQEAKRID